jgi:hypothetical protein
MPTAGSVQYATSWAASFGPPLFERPLDPSSVDAPTADDPSRRRPDPVVEFVKLVLTQWMAAFITYEVLAARTDRRGRLLPTLGL